MSWYDDEAKEFEHNSQPKREGKALAQQIHIWAKLRAQVERDVIGINKNPTWAARLRGLPLYVEDVENVAGYRIRKLGVPKLDIKFWHAGDHVMIDRQFYGKPLPGYSWGSERLDFFGQAGGLLLQRADDMKLFDLPEEMSKYLLEPIIQLLKET